MNLYRIGQHGIPPKKSMVDGLGSVPKFRQHWEHVVDYQGADHVHNPELIQHNMIQ